VKPLLLALCCLILGGCDSLIHEALAPQRVAVDPTAVEPLFADMHSLGVSAYGRGGACDYLFDARGTYVTSTTMGDCEDISADGGAATLPFDSPAQAELDQLRSREKALGLPAMKSVALVYDEHGLLTNGGFGVDVCVEYTFEPASPMDLDHPAPSERGAHPWTVDDVCGNQ